MAGRYHREMAGKSAKMMAVAIAALSIKSEPVAPQASATGFVSFLFELACKLKYSTASENSGK